MSKKWLPGEAIPDGWYWAEMRIEHPHMVLVGSNTLSRGPGHSGYKPHINPFFWMDEPDRWEGWVLYGPISIEEIKGNEKVET